MYLLVLLDMLIDSHENIIFFTIEDEESSMILLQYSGRRDRNVDKSNMDEQNKTY